VGSIGSAHGPMGRTTAIDSDEMEKDGSGARNEINGFEFVENASRIVLQSQE
jgi:hypothetical protein